jgi:hypothetical protein
MSLLNRIILCVFIICVILSGFFLCFFLLGWSFVLIFFSACIPLAGLFPFLKMFNNLQGFMKIVSTSPLAVFLAIPLIALPVAASATYINIRATAEVESEIVYEPTLAPEVAPEVSHEPAPSLPPPAPPPAPAPQPVPSPPRVIQIPSSLFLLSREDVRGDTFLCPEKAEYKIKYKLHKLMEGSIWDFIIEMDRLIQMLPSDLRWRYNEFRIYPMAGKGYYSTLGLSDSMVQYANANRDSLSDADFVELHIMAVLLTLGTFTFIDCFDTSHLTSLALNRLWDTYKRIALHTSTFESYRHVFFAIAASSSFIRIGRSYNNEVQNKRASDIHGSRVVHIHMMEIAEGHNSDVSLAWAHRAEYLTKLAINEGLILPGEPSILRDEERRIQAHIIRHSRD